MKQILHNGYVLREVTKGSCEMIGNGLQLYRGKMSETELMELSNLLAQPYNVMGFASEATEEMAKGIVECRVQPNKDSKEYPSGIWKNYMAEKSKYGGLECDTALDSLRSLLKSHSLQPETTLILKQIL